MHGSVKRLELFMDTLDKVNVYVPQCVFIYYTDMIVEPLFLLCGSKV